MEWYYFTSCPPPQNHHNNYNVYINYPANTAPIAAISHSAELKPIMPTPLIGSSSNWMRKKKINITIFVGYSKQ